MKLLTAAILMAFACSAAPVETAPTTARELTDAETCAQVEPCFPIRADNQLHDDAVLNINGVRVGELPGNTQKTFWVRKSLLREGNCLYASAFFRLPGFTLYESRQCGESFRLLVGVEGKLWVNPRGAQQ